MLTYLILAVAPGIFWMWFFWRKDTYEKEPAGYIVKTFFLGAAAVILVIIPESLLTTHWWIANMMMVGIVEEAAKFLAVYLYLYRKSEFNEIMDGIIYSAAASLGFASLENLFYIISYGPEVIVGRAILSTLGHVLFASFWGYALGVKKVTGRGSIATGLIASMVAHGVYDVIVISGYWLITLSVVPFMIILYKSMSGKIKRSLEMSPFRSTEDLAVPGEIRCPRCGATVPTDSRFCPRCGRHM